MTAQFAGMVNRQLWDETLRTLSGLSDSTIKLSVELEARVAELEVELAVWKQAHSVAIEASERETKAHNVHIASLNKQLSDTDGFRNINPFIFCLINAHSSFFNQSLLSQGFLGGQNAAHHLTKLISEHLSHEGVLTVFRGLSFWVTLYFNKAELVSTIVNRGVCSPQQLDGFLAGFSQASPRFTTIDVGIGENGADNKIREYILTYTRFPEALRVFLGGCYESNPLYATAFNTLDSAQLLGKLVLLRGVSEESSDPMFTIPSLNVDDLFIQYHESSSHTPRQLTPLNVVSLETVSVSSNGGLISPQSPLPVRKIMRYVDPKYPLHKQAPPPCNEHYLMTCSKGGGACKYSHDYVLSPVQLATLAANAKKAPCNWLKNGLQCPYGDACCWGHVCPNGSHCFHQSKGKCWFKGESMHDGQPGFQNR